MLEFDGNFAYSLNAWSAVKATLPDQVDEAAMRRDLEGAAETYLAFTLTSQKSEWTKAVKANAGRVAKGADEFLEALRAAASDPEHLGFGWSQGALDLNAADREFSEFLGRVEFIADREREVADVYGSHIDGRKGEKAIRRRFIEQAIQIENFHAKRIFPTQVGRLLDFLLAASRPVLVGADAFGEGESGRDALGKLVDKIAKEGYRHKFLAWEISPTR